MRNGGIQRRTILASCVAVLTFASALLLDELSSPDEARAERIRRGGMIIAFDGRITPNVLPRKGVRPITARLAGHVRAIDGGPLPQLRRLTIEINRHARFASRGLPICRIEDVSDAFAEEALRNCRDSLIGDGHFGVRLAFPDQGMTYARGKVYAFHSRVGRRRAVLMHVVTTAPAAVAMTVPLKMVPVRRGTYGLKLISPPLPELIGHYIYTTDFAFRLGRRFSTGGTRRSYLRAGCPAPSGFPGAVFSLARATYEFTDGRRVKQTLARNCKVSGG